MTQPLGRVSWREEVDAVVRGASGGLLFGVPLLFTMELWEIGGAANPANLAAVFLITCVVVVLLMLAVMATSLLVSYAIVYEAGFGDQAKRRQQQGVLQHPLTETAVSYVLALTVAALMLFFFGGLTHVPPAWALGQVVVLGLPAAIGGAAGRVAI